MKVLPGKEQGVINPAEPLCFAFRNNELLVKLIDNTAMIPRIDEIAPVNQHLVDPQYIGKFGEHLCFSVDLPDAATVPEGMVFKGLRGLFGILKEELFALAGRSYQVLQWEQTHQFCGRCGSSTENKTDEHAKICPNCGLVRYPNVFPAIIAAVLKGNQILLARAHRHPKGRYSVLAGFVEPGETLEDCVRREVKEEVGVDIKNIRYFGSQSWPFPNSLMIGFIADYGGGKIHVDPKEIVDAKWFTASDLPNIPGKISIARQLIDWFIKKYPD